MMILEFAESMKLGVSPMGNPLGESMKGIDNGNAIMVDGRRYVNSSNMFQYHPYPILHQEIQQGIQHCLVDCDSGVRAFIVFV